MHLSAAIPGGNPGGHTRAWCGIRRLLLPGDGGIVSLLHFSKTIPRDKPPGFVSVDWKRIYERVPKWRRRSRAHGERKRKFLHFPHKFCRFYWPFRY